MRWPAAPTAARMATALARPMRPAHAWAGLAAAPLRRMSAKATSKSARKSLAKQRAGLDEFHRYYAEVYGARWTTSLFASLRRPVRMAALLNRYAGEANLRRMRPMLRGEGAAPTPLEWWRPQAAGRPAATATSAAPVHAPSLPRLAGPECWWFPGEMRSSAAADAADSASASDFLNDSQGGDEESAPAYASGADVEDSDPSDPDDASPSRFPSPSSLRAHMDGAASVDGSEGVAAPLPFYPLDLASVLAVHAMGLQGGERVLDLCAAPGGKSVAIAQYLHLETERAQAYIHAAVARADAGAGDGGEDGSTNASAAAAYLAGPSLTSNDPSAPRRGRLQSTLKQYLPYSVAANHARVQVKGINPTTAQANKIQHEDYDAVLVDAPCSTDRHLLHGSPRGLENWTAGARFRRDAERQELLLLAALRAVRPGGVVLYSTCSLSPVENDDVIAAVRRQCDKWIAKGRAGHGGTQVDFVVEPFEIATAHAYSTAQPVPAADAAASVAPASTRLQKKSSPTAASASAPTPPVLMPFGEPTEFGWIILPDQPEPAHAASSSPSATASTDAAATATATATASDATTPDVAVPPSPHGFGPIYMCKLRRVAVQPNASAELKAARKGPVRGRPRS